MASPVELLLTDLSTTLKSVLTWTPNINLTIVIDMHAHVYSHLILVS